MGIRDQYAVEISVRRLVRTGNKESFGSLTTLTGHIQPASSEMVALSDGDYSKSFTLYTEIAANLEIGDEVTINSVIYFVKGVKKFDIGTLTHREFLLQLKNT